MPDTATDTRSSERIQEISNADQIHPIPAAPDPKRLKGTDNAEEQSASRGSGDGSKVSRSFRLTLFRRRLNLDIARGHDSGNSVLVNHLAH